MARSLLVTGTDTGIGKTTVASAIAAALHRRGIDVGVIKPVETGCAESTDGSLIPADALQLRWAAARDDSLERICPYRLRDPLAPAIAAAREDVELALSDVVHKVRAMTESCALGLVEGAGGLLVPLAGTATFADLARACGLRLLVIVGNRLGALNHARLTLDWARSEGLDVLGYVVNTLQPTDDLAAQTNVAALRELCGPSLGVFPFVGTVAHTEPERERLAEIAERSLTLDALLR